MNGPGCLHDPCSDALCEYVHELEDGLNKWSRLWAKTHAELLADREVVEAASRLYEDDGEFLGAFADIDALRDALSRRRNDRYSREARCSSAGTAPIA